jgi:hypothetical protein
VNKLYLLAKKIHRITLVVFVSLGGIMAATGLLLKYFRVALALRFDLSLLRELHSTTSTFFAVVFVFMAASGIIMYVAPLVRKKQVSKI